ncbi:MAG: carboxypeptidase-like regulatory domain-containing protein, partial [Planctomycetota bacterium]
LENVAAGTYLLVAHDAFTGSFARRQERLIVVKEGEDLVLSLGTGRGAVLTGRITSAGVPVAHANVQALLASADLERRRQVVTTRSDAEGNYVFTDIPAGDHLLTVSLPWSAGNPVRFGAHVLPGPVTILDLVLPDSGIEGTAFDLDTGDALAGVLLRLTRDTGGAEGTFLMALTREMGEIETDSSGRFRFPALTPGDYRLDAFRDGYGQTSAGEIRVLPGGFVNVRIEMPPAGTLKGRVLDDRGRPVTSARIRFLDPDGRVATSRPWYPVDDDGRFRIRELRTGTYRVEASAPGYARVEEPEAEVFPGGGVEVVLSLKIEGRLELTVYGEGGVLLAGARISITDFWGQAVPFPKPKPGPLTPWRDPALTGDDGRLLVRNLPPGVYTVTARLPGHRGPAVRVRVLDGELSRGAVVLLPAQ